MGCCDQKRKHKCGTKQQAICTSYKGDIPEYSKLHDEDCITIEETTNDTYELISDIRDRLDLTGYNRKCISVDKSQFKYDKEEDYKLTDILNELTEKVCELGGGDDDGDSLDLDFKCLVSPCGNEISTLKDLLQTLINEVCELKNK